MATRDKHPSSDRAETATLDAPHAPHADPPRRQTVTPPLPGTPEAAFLAALNAAYADDQDPDDADLPRAMRPHMRRILEQDR